MSDGWCNREVEPKDQAIVDLLVFDSLKYSDYRLLREMNQMDSISPSAVKRHPTLSPTLKRDLETVYDPGTWYVAEFEIRYKESSITTSPAANLSMVPILSNN